ncbi:ras-related protein Rab-14-like [Hydractinia symbiolongicarpus]|uniref:ras-related protein Rab-14-like n=1 Tax=Hydractinia symbiolongicarpus TaxID=13093 RepID=UPI00254BCEE4|nr:ras-related protein Rab-14-like [Hydractinia symbiolongicarpus]XP_057309290.1 ras-related protein Rab-14-like [Hydractinia symbiolongicarpus]XP_057309291.1 ras-related protein Rab-14-like [Hydractinia symbiolongicarpus]
MFSKSEYLKLLMIGDRDAGRVDLRHLYIYNECPDMYGISDFLFTNVTINGDQVQLQIWDNVHGRHRLVYTPCARGALGVLLVYNISSRESFDHLTDWLSALERVPKEDVVITLVANEVDSEQPRVVTTEEGRKFAKERNLLFIETSVRRRVNINEMFDLTINNVIETCKIKGIDPLAFGRSKMMQHNASYSKQSKCNI